MPADRPTPADTLNAEDVRARQERAVAAAAGAGRELGLDITEPRVLHDVFSVVVHLRPTPVVARVPTVLPRTVAANPAAQSAQQRRELAVTTWLAERGHPVVPPSPLVPRQPIRRGGFSMTFWQYVGPLRDENAPGPDLIRHTARLHAALRDYPDELRFLMPLDDSIPDGLAQLQHRPDLIEAAILDRAQADWALLEPLTAPAAFAARFPDVDLQPVHGDAPTYNIIVTAEGPLWSDFEHVTRGPVEWDMAFTDEQAGAAYARAAAEFGLRPLHQRLLRAMESARMIQLIACLPLAPRLPGLFDGLRPWIEQWASTPPLALGD